MLQYALEQIKDIQPEIEALIGMHYEELADTSVPLDVDWAQYHLMQDFGMYYTVTVRLDDKLIGYLGFIVTKHLRYQSMKMAVADVYYLHPDYRKGQAGLGLLRSGEDFMRNLGVNKIVQHVKLKHDHGIIFERMGYKPLERSYVKELN